MATVVDIFEINVQPIAEQLKVLSENINATKETLTKLKDENKQYTEEGIAVTAALKAQQKEYRSLETVLVNQSSAIKEVAKAQSQEIDIRKIESNSIETNRKLYNSLYGEYVRMSAEQRAKTIPTLKALSDELKKQEGAVGDTRRNVGNYAEGFKSALGDLNAFGVSANSVTKGLDAAKLGFQSAGGGVKGFSAALATTGLPIIILAVQQLINVFEEFKPVADAVESATIAVKDAFGALISGGSISQAVKQGQELLNVMRDLEDTENAYQIALDKSKVKIDTLIIASKDKGKTEKERIALIDEANKVEEKAYKESVSRNEKSLALQIKIFAQKNKLSGEEIDLLTQGTKADALALRERLEQSGKYNEKELNTIQEGLKKRVQLEGQSLVLQEKLQNRRNALLESISAEQEKANEKALQQEQKRQEERKKHLDELKKIEEQHNKEVQSLSDEFDLSEREKLNKKYQDKIDLLNSDNEKELALQIKINNERNEALKKFDEDNQKKIEAQKKKNAETEKAINAKTFNDKIEQNKRSLDLELESVDLSVGTEQEKANRKRDIQLKYLEEQLALTREFFGADGKVTQEELDGITKIENAIAKARKGVQVKDEKATFGSSIGLTKEDIGQAQEGLQSIQTAVNAISSVLSASTEIRLNEIEAEKNAEIQAVEESTLSKEQKEAKIRGIEKKYAGEKYEAEKKAFETNKALQIVNAIIAGALGVVSAFQLGPIGGAIAAAAIAVTTAAQIAVISSQKPPPPPKFAKGVIGLDGAGNGTSDSIDAKLSRGESVMTARATERFAPMLAQMELAVGNRPNFQLGKHKFATGFIPTSDGGFYARTASASMLTNSQLIKGFESAVKSMPSPNLNYNEFSQFTKSVDNSVTISEL